MIETKQSDGSWPWKIYLDLRLPDFIFLGKEQSFDATTKISKEYRYWMGTFNVDNNSYIIVRDVKIVHKFINPKIYRS